MNFFPVFFATTAMIFEIGTPLSPAGAADAEAEESEAPCDEAVMANANIEATSSPRSSNFIVISIPMGVQSGFKVFCIMRSRRVASRAALSSGNNAQPGPS